MRIYPKILLIFIFSSQLALASEVDQFTRRFEYLADAAPIVNAKANLFLGKALKMANQDSRRCNEKVLYKSMRTFFRNHISGKLTRFILDSKAVPKRTIPLKKSIYREFGPFTSPVLGGLGKLSDTSGVIIRMGENQIGSDKFEHFFGRGYAYFVRYYKRNYSLEKLLKYGDSLERYRLGALTTAVYSYGDLTANFNGMRFWNNVLQKHDDILGREYNLGPYVVCKNGRWKQVKRINFLDYIDAAWDEGNNCSNFRSHRAYDDVMAALLELSLNDTSHSYVCPMQLEKMRSLVDKYGEAADFLLNFRHGLVFE